MKEFWRHFSLHQWIVCWSFAAPLWHGEICNTLSWKQPSQTISMLKTGSSMAWAKKVKCVIFYYSVGRLSFKVTHKSKCCNCGVRLTIGENTRSVFIELNLYSWRKKIWIIFLRDFFNIFFYLTLTYVTVTLKQTPSLSWRKGARKQGLGCPCKNQPCLLDSNSKLHKLQGFLVLSTTMEPFLGIQMARVVSVEIFCEVKGTEKITGTLFVHLNQL